MRRPALSISLSMSMLAFVLLAACSPALPVQPSGDPAAEAGQLVPDGDDRVLFQPYLGRVKYCWSGGRGSACLTASGRRCRSLSPAA